MSKFVHKVTLLSMVFALVSCSTHRISTNYSSLNQKGMRYKAGSWAAKEVGNVHANSGGAIWVGCREMVNEALREVTQQARNMNANAIGKFNWEFSDNSTPACKKRWAFLLLVPFIFTPLFGNAEVRATTYRLGNTAQLGPDMYRLPLSETDKEKIISAFLQ